VLNWTSAGTPTTLTEVFYVFSQSLHVEAKIVPQSDHDRFLQILSTESSFISHTSMQRSMVSFQKGSLNDTRNMCISSFLTSAKMFKRYCRILWICVTYKTGFRFEDWIYWTYTQLLQHFTNHCLWLDTLDFWPHFSSDWTVIYCWFLVAWPRVGPRRKHIHCLAPDVIYCCVFFAAGIV
jgi:hypothetical protein